MADRAVVCLAQPTLETFDFVLRAVVTHRPPTVSTVMQRFGIADDKLHFPNDKLPHRQHRCHFHSSAIAEASYRIGEGMGSWHALFVSYRSTIKWISTYHASAHFLSPNPTWLRSCGCCVGTCNLQACIFEPETKSTFEPSLRASCMSISCGGHDGIRPQGLMLRTVRLLALRLSCSRNGHQVVASSVGMPLKLKQVFIPPVLSAATRLVARATAASR